MEAHAPHKMFVHVLQGKPQPIMLKILPIMLLSNAQKSNPLCSILCPQLLLLCYTSCTILLFLMTT